MSTSAKPASADQVREIWAESLPVETDFWKRWFETKGLQWPQEYARRVDPALEFQQHLRRFLNTPEGGTARILDVGSGPLTLLGKVWPGRTVELVPVDPLAEHYDKVMAEVGVTPLVRARLGHGERLLDLFPPSSFDLAYAANCLDHSYNPIVCLRQMLAVVKPGCWVVTEHLPNEGQAENYHGLHQWNFTVENGRFIIWRPGTKLDVQEQLGDFAKVECAGNEVMVHGWIKKLG